MALPSTLTEILEYRGVEGLVAAKLTKDDETDLTYGDVFAVAGVAEISKTTENSTETHYYDNKPAIIIESTGSDTVTITASAIPMEVLAEITGQVYDATTAAMFEGPREKEYFAIGYQTKKTNGDLVYVWRLKGTFAIPDETSATEDAGTGANGQTLVFTGIDTNHKFTKNADKDGNARPAKATIVDVAAGLANVSAFFDSVVDPDSVQVKTP